MKRGETLEVTDRGRVVAHLVPVESGRSLLDRLVAEGRAIPPTVSTHEPLTMPPLSGDPTVSVADELAAARDEERW